MKKRNKITKEQRRRYAKSYGEKRKRLMLCKSCNNPVVHIQYLYKGKLIHLRESTYCPNHWDYYGAHKKINFNI